jgi:hypothetical protein
MAKTNFIEVAPKLIADAFAEAGAQSVDGASFIASNNSVYAGVLNKVGKTIMNSAEFSNPLSFLYSEGMEEGAILEMIATQVDSWINDVSTTPANVGRDALKQYPAKVISAYSDLNAVITAPVTIYDKALKQAFLNGTDEKMYLSQMVEMKNSIDRKRFMCGKELLNRAITDDAAGTSPTKAYRHQTITGVTAINSKEAAVKVWAKINSLIGEFRVNTSKYNPAGYYGQVAPIDMNGNPNIVLIGRANAITDLQTQASDIFHKDNLNIANIEFVMTDDFGGITSSVAAVYDSGDGSQTANMAAATFTDPHATTAFILCERSTFIATTNWDDVETRRDTGARATTFEPLSSHTFAQLPWKPFVELKFDTED